VCVYRRPIVCWCVCVGEWWGVLCVCVCVECLERVCAECVMCRVCYVCAVCVLRAWHVCVCVVCVCVWCVCFVSSEIAPRTHRTPPTPCSSRSGARRSSGGQRKTIHRV